MTSKLLCVIELPRGAPLECDTLMNRRTSRFRLCFHRLSLLNPYL